MSVFSVTWTWQLRMTTSGCDQKHQAMKGTHMRYHTSWKISISRKAQIFLPSTSLPPSLSQAGLWFLSTHSGEANWRANPWCYLSFCHLMFDTLYQAVAGLSPCNIPCHGFCLWGLLNAFSEWGDQLWEGQDAGDRTPSASLLFPG